MLEQRALSQGLGGLRTRGVELGLRLCDIQSRSDARAVPLLGQPDGAIEGLNGLVQYRDFAVETAQLDVVVHKLGEQRQAGVFEIRGGGLGIRMPAATSLRIWPHKSSS